MFRVREIGRFYFLTKNVEGVTHVIPNPSLAHFFVHVTVVQYECLCANCVYLWLKNACASFAFASEARRCTAKSIIWYGGKGGGSSIDLIDGSLIMATGFLRSLACTRVYTASPFFSFSYFLSLFLSPFRF